MNQAAKFISYVFHPILLYFYLIFLTHAMIPYQFYGNERAIGLFLILSFITVVLFPMVGVLVMRKLGLFSSVELSDKEQRVGPLIVTSVFFIWYFINVKSDPDLPIVIPIISLASAIGISIGFFINNFSKISLHMIGAGLFLTSVLMIGVSFVTGQISMNIPLMGLFDVSPVLIVFAATVITGLIGSSRLQLGAHRMEDVAGGFVVGIISVIISYKILI